MIQFSINYGSSTQYSSPFSVRKQDQDGRPEGDLIGVNIGDIITKDGAIFGDSVNVAARVQALAEPGGICLSGAACEQVRGKVEAAFRDMGAHQVKNIARAIEVFDGSRFDALVDAAGPRGAALPGVR